MTIIFIQGYSACSFLTSAHCSNPTLLHQNPAGSWLGLSSSSACLYQSKLPSCLSLFLVSLERN